MMVINQITESMERQRINSEILSNRLNTLREHYDSICKVLERVSLAHPDGFKCAFKPVLSSELLSAFKCIKGGQDALNERINMLSIQYVKMMDHYEFLKDNHPDWLTEK